MLMPWLALMAVFTGPVDRDPGRDRLAVRPEVAASIPARPVSNNPTPAVERPGRDRRDRPGSSPGVEDCDTAEGVDETWLFHLDAIGAIPTRRTGWARPRSLAALGAATRARPDPPASFPLRC